MNAACRKVTHIGKMDRGFSMLMILPLAPLENVQVFVGKQVLLFYPSCPCLCFQFCLNIVLNCVDLLQSVGSKLPSKPSEKVLESSSSSETALKNDRMKYSYTDFSVVDHRVKLYLYLHVFQHEQEELLFLLRVSIFAAITTRNLPHSVYLIKQIYN